MREKFAGVEVANMKPFARKVARKNLRNTICCGWRRIKTQDIVFGGLKIGLTKGILSPLRLPIPPQWRVIFSFLHNFEYLFTRCGEIGV